MYNYRIAVCLRVYAFVYEMMSRLIAKGIISYSMQRLGRITVKPIGIVFICDECGGLMFNAQRYMQMNDAYFASLTVVRFLYELKKIFDRILYDLQYLDKEHTHHFTLDLDQLDGIFEYRFIQISSYSFPVTNVELEYMFDTLGFRWLHHDSSPYLLYLLEKLVDGSSEERTRPPPLQSITTTTL